jgi:alcohol dehydrogenase class IV
MWFFRSPFVVFGEDALSWLAQFSGERAFIVTDEIVSRLGFVQLVQDQLAQAGIAYQVFTQVEPDPSLETVKRCAHAMTAFLPDWIIGLGGGSCLDAAKAAWFLYEVPDTDLSSVTPLVDYGLRSKARLITIPTTAGSGAEVTGGAVLKDVAGERKLEMTSYEIVPDVTLVDPRFSTGMDISLTADTGIDVLAHAVEGYSSTFSNDFSDALCLQAARYVFEYLPRAVRAGVNDPEARQKMANAATMAGLGIGNSHIALAHALSHTLGAVYEIPHGRITGLCLPYSIEFTAQEGDGRYLGLAEVLGLETSDERQAGLSLAKAIRSLLDQIGQPLSLGQVGILPEELESRMEDLCDRIEIDPSLGTSRRFPYRDDLKRLLRAMSAGQVVDF